MNPAGLAPSDPTGRPVAEAPRDSPLDAGRTPGGPVPLPPVDPALTEEPGALIAEGANVDVYAVDDRRVLRRYRSGRDTAPEVHLLQHVVAHGFPAPTVLAASGPDILMERLHGPTLLQALGAEEITLPDAAAILADLH